MKPRQRRLARARLDVVRALKRPQMVTVTYSIEDDEEITSENSLKTDIFTFVEVPINSWANQLSFVGGEVC